MTSPMQKEWNSLIKREKTYLNKGSERKDSALNKILAEKVPPKLQNTLNIAFAKAFTLVFEKGTGIIEKTYNRDDAERMFKINSYAVNLKADKTSLRQFSKQANKAVGKNLLLSGIEGVGLGILALDCPIFHCLWG